MKVIHHILATAGHVDHGKSSLVKALTGVDTDRLPEEKTRGITIDLGFAQLRLPGRTAEYDVGIVDVPGHEDFIKNMVAGVAAVDAALLVVAADDGWMPQSQEHLDILRYLGVPRAIVAITKCDLAPDNKARGQIADRLRYTPFADCPVVAVSTRMNAGLTALRQELVRLFDNMPALADTSKPRLAVDRAFSLNGAGTVVTGTLVGGRLARGQHVLIQPGGKIAHVRAMQTHNHDVDHTVAGMRVALNVPEVEPNVSVRRGDAVTVEGVGAVSSVWDVSLWRTAGERKAPLLRTDATLHLHHGSAAVKTHVQLARDANLDPGCHAIARVRLERPLFALAGDRFLLRDASAQWTLAGGIIVNVEPPAKAWRDRIPAYARRAALPKDAPAWVATALELEHFVHRDALLRSSQFSVAEICAAVESLESRETAARASDFIVDPLWWKSLQARAAAIVDAHHVAKPQQRGLALPALHAAVGLPDPAFHILVATLCEEGFSRAGTYIKRPSHQPTLPPALESVGRRLRAMLAKVPLDPPSRAQLAPEPHASAALAFLIDTGEVTELSPDLLITTEAYSLAADTVKAYLCRHGKGTVSELKQALSTSRRIMVPLLERLDRDGITRRAGDLRVLGAAALA